MRALIGEQIRRLRESRSITQETAASTLGMTRQRVARIEKGQSDITYEIILKLAELFGVDSHEITDVCNKKAAVSFRGSDEDSASFDKIEEMIGFFYANKSVYDRMNPECGND